MAKIINFPNSPKSIAQIEAEAMELSKMATETSLRLAMSSPIWEFYELTAEDIVCLEQFGEVMDFPPDVAARLITRLAKLIKVKTIDEPWS
mgnify:CR=1 FL=1